MMTTMWKQTKEKRTDALSEWQSLVMKTEEDVAEQKKENKDLRRQIHTLRDDHHANMLRISIENAQCRQENAELKGEIKLLQTGLQRTQQHVGMEVPGVTGGCLIIAEMDGTIRDASPSTGPVLEWLAPELIGKNLEVLVPDDIKPLYREALAKIMSAGVEPWTERTVLSEALTKSGRRVKVSIRVKAWQTGGGHWLLSGEIKERKSS
jgi:cell division protein FtsB